MGGYCVVGGCKNRGGHIFPKNNDLRKAWIAHVQREASWSPSIHSRVCPHHFLPSDYIIQTTYGQDSLKKHLVKGAIPSVFGWKLRGHKKAYETLTKRGRKGYAFASEEELQKRLASAQASNEKFQRDETNSTTPHRVPSTSLPRPPWTGASNKVDTCIEESPEQHQDSTADQVDVTVDDNTPPVPGSSTRQLDKDTMTSSVPLSCAVCPVKFEDLDLLLQHMAGHTAPAAAGGQPASSARQIVLSRTAFLRLKPILQQSASRSLIKITKGGGGGLGRPIRGRPVPWMAEDKSEEAEAEGTEEAEMEPGGEAEKSFANLDVMSMVKVEMDEHTNEKDEMDEHTMVKVESDEHAMVKVERHEPRVDIVTKGGSGGRGRPI